MNKEMIDEFKKEVLKKLDSAQEYFSNLTTDKDFSDNLNLILKSFHALKGSAGMFGFMDLQSHLSKLESLLESQKTNGSITKIQIDYFLSGIEAAKKLLAGEKIKFNHSSLTGFNSSNLSTQTNNISSTEGLDSTKPKIRGLIYIIDNDQINCDILIKVLNSLEFGLKNFSTIPELTESLKVETPDLIISKIDFFEFINKIKEPNFSIPIIALSEKLTKEINIELSKHELKGFIQKPIEEEYVKLEIERVFTQLQANVLLQKSINYILYQFNELDNFLKTSGKEAVRLSLKDELKNILHLQKNLSQTKNK